MNRTTLQKAMTRTASQIAEKGKQIESLRWTLAEQAFKFRATFPAGGEKAALAQAATATGFAEGDIGNLIRAYEVQQDLTPAQAEHMEKLGWTTDSALTLRGKGMTTAKRTSLLNWSEKQGTRNVKKLREQKGKLVGGTPRNRQSENDKRIALAKTLAKDLDRLFKNHNPLALAAGARFAQEHGSKGDIAALITFAAAQKATEKATA